MVCRILRKASLPVSVIQFLPDSGKKFVDAIQLSDHMAGIHSSGSTAFSRKGCADGTAKMSERYRDYPHLVRATRDKNFHAVRSSDSDDDAVYLTV